MLRTEELENKLRMKLYEFFADQCGVEVNVITDDTDIIEDIGGDSLIFLQILEKWKKEYDINIEFRAIGKYLIKNPANTVGKALELSLMLICDKEKFLSLN
jgi:acyl carrier protein